MNHSQNTSKPSSELAFEHVITILFDKVKNGPVSTFFITTFGRKHIHDMIHVDFSKLDSSQLNQSEKDLISSLCICNRELTKFYGLPIKEDWSNVTPEHFDNIGEEYGYIPINRDVVEKSSTDVFQHVIKDLFKQELDGPIAMSLLEHTKGSKEIDLVSNMTDDQIDKLHYYTISSEPSPESKYRDVKDYPGPEVIKRVDLSKDYKSLLKVFTSFCKHLKGQGNDMRSDWSNIDLGMFTRYR